MRSTIGGPLISTGVVPASFDTTNFFARVDHSINERNQLSARYSLYHINAVNSRTVGGLNAVSRGTGLGDTDQTVQVSNVTTISSRTLNEARFQYTNSRLDAPVNDKVGPAVGISGVANFGTATFSPLGRDINLFEVVDNISTQRGDHSLKAGGGFLYNRVNIFFPGALQGVYTFTSLNNFLTGNYINYQQAFGVPNQFQSNPNVGMFVQDEWRVRPDLTINAGLRYDLQFLPDPIQTDTDNYRAAIGNCLCSRRSQDRHPRELWTLLRSHSAASYIECSAARWLEVPGRAVVADPTRRSRVSQRLDASTSNPADKTKHHAHRSEHRIELQPAGQLPD